MMFSPKHGYTLLQVNDQQSYMKRKLALSIFAAFAISLIGWHLFSPSILGSTDSSLPVHTATNLTAHKSKVLPHDWTFSDKAPQGWDASWEKPAELKVVALVFYGRRASVSILECYLKRNLVSNGGMLAEVIFLARTQDEDDLEWLDDAVNHEPLFTRRDVTTFDKDYRSAYDLCEDDVMYIKIDDDIVFFEDTTIPTLVHTRWTHPEYYVVSANIMNQPSLSWIHHHLGVVKPYFPELTPSEDESVTSSETRTPNSKRQEASSSSSEPHPALIDWRASHLPSWSGPSDFSALDYASPHTPHRWLPLRKGSDDRSSYFTALDRTPITETSYSAWSAGLYHWQIAAQEHYCFLEHLEDNDLWRYKFPIWDYNYERMGIQFIAMMGRDINAAKPMEEDDESYFSEVMTQRLGRHAVVAGQGLAAHYSFGPQREGMATTDVLERYRSFAEENICFGRRRR